MPISHANILDKTKRLLADSQSLVSDAFQEQAVLTHRKSLLEEIVCALEKMDDRERLSYLEDALNKNWELIKGSALSYTARPTDDLTELLCDIAAFLSQEQKEAPKLSIEYLMPDVCIELGIDGKNPLVEWPLAQILKTHITSDSTKTLIPVARLPDYLKEEPGNQRFNYYFNSDKMDDKEAFISEDEMRRLVEHSTQTKDFYEATQSYQLLCDKQNNLLANLNRLCKLLHINSAHGGIGRQENAAGGAYPAIISFFDYYNALSDDSKNNIPQEVKQELEKIFDFSSDKTKNTDATRQIQTCIGDMRENLMKQVRHNEAKLEKIGLQDESGQKLIREQKEALDNQKEVLINQIAGNAYTEGFDKLGITKALLDSLGVRITINTFNDLRHFMASSEREIELFLTDTEVRDQVLRQLNTIEALIAFLHDTSTSKIPLLIKTCGNLIQSSNDISALLMTFEGVQFDVVLSTTKSMIKSAYEFRGVLQLLSPEQCAVVCEAMKSNLGNLIKSADEFRLVLQPLSPEQRATVYEAMKSNLGNLITSGYNFQVVLQLLSLEQRATVYEAMKSNLGNLITSAEEFRVVLKLLSPEQRTMVCEAMKSNLGNLITSAYDFRLVLQLLSPEQRVVVCEAMKSNLGNLIKSVYDFQGVLQLLSPEQRAVVCETMKSNLGNLITSVYYFQLVLQPLSPEQCATVCQAMESNLDNLIKSASDFRLVLQPLSPEQCAKVCEAMKSNLGNLIKSASDFRLVLQPLSPEQYAKVCEAMKSNLGNFIKSTDDFRGVLQPLSPEQCAMVCEAMKSNLDNLITSADDFRGVLQPLSPEQCAMVYKSSQEILARLIKNPKTDFPKLIKSGNHPHMIKLLSYYSFLGMIKEIENKPIENANEKRIDARNKLCSELRNASETYFNDNTLSQASYNDFKKTCTAALKNAYFDLGANKSWDRLLKKILLAVVTLGIAPLASAIKNKKETGTFKSRFFQAPLEAERDRIENSIEHIANPKKGC